MAQALFQRLVDDNARRLDPRRFLHVMGVTHAAASLAFRHGLDARAAAVAALIHDRSKGMGPEEIESDLRALPRLQRALERLPFHR